MAQTQTAPVASPSRRPRIQFSPRAFLPGWLADLLRNPKAALGLSILMIFLLMAIFAEQLVPYDPDERVGRQSAPSAEHILGIERTGKDVLSQVITGARLSLTVGFLTGTVIVVIGLAMGVTAGYVGGFVDDFLSLITNVFLIIPSFPLIIVVAGWLDRPGPYTLVLVLSLTSWAWGARVFRSQTLTLRNSEFVAAARVSGEPAWRIILFEIMPNMTSLIVSSWIGAVNFVILAEAGLSFIGLGNPNDLTWGTILYWSQNNQALLTGAWWTFIPPGVCIALVGFSLTMINYGLDEVTNPRLRKEKAG
jgi:peptide/nickel transport system permease protein